MAKSLRKKLEENGKLESAMSYADIKIPNNSLKERVASRANSIMNNSVNKNSFREHLLKNVGDSFEKAFSVKQGRKYNIDMNSTAKKAEKKVEGRTTILNITDKINEQIQQNANNEKKKEIDKEIYNNFKNNTIRKNDILYDKQDQYYSFDKSKVLLGDKKETLGEKFVKLDKEGKLVETVVDTVKYAPKYAEAALLGGKKGLESTGQYFTETVPEQNSNTYKNIQNRRLQMQKNMELSKNPSMITDKNLGKTFWQIARDGDTEQINKLIEEAPNVVARKITELMPSTGQSLTGAAVTAVNGIAGFAYYFGSAGQDYFDSAKERGFADKDAFTYSGIMSALDSGMEQVMTTQSLEFLSSKISGKEIRKGAFSFIGSQTLENAIQEGIMEPVDDAITLLTAGKEYLQEDDVTIRFVQASIDGALQGILQSSGTAVVSRIFSGAISTEQAIKEAIKGKSVQEVKELAKAGANKRIAELEAAMISSMEDVEGKVMQFNMNEANRMQNNDISQANQQVIPQEQKTAQNENMGQATKTDNMQAQNGTTFQERNQKYEIFKQQLKDNGLNYDDKRANAMFDLPNKRGIDVEVNAELFKKADGSINSNINAIYSIDVEGKRKIIYNPQANLDSVIEKNTIHEVVHDLEGTKEYNNLSKMVLGKIENTAEFQEAYNSLKEAYSKVTDGEGRILYNKDSADFDNMIKQEAVADYLGENLGNQEYINELVNGKETKNIAQKIYDAIINFLDKVTGYKSEEAYLRGLKNKFEKAFNAEVDSNKISTKFSISPELLNDNGKLKTFKEQLQDENFSKTSPYVLSEDSLGVADNNLPIIINPSVIDKIYNKHNISKEELFDLPDKIKNYTLVTKSQNREDSIIVFIDQVDSNNRPIMISMALDKKSGTYNVNNITSVYGRNNGTTFIENLIKNGKILKQGKKIKQWLTSTGVQFSKDISNALSTTSIPSSKENVNTTKYSMQNNKNNVKNLKDSSFSFAQNHKQEQLNVIQEANPMTDDYHTGIRKVEDIKTLQETLQDSDWSDYDEFNPDLTRTMIEEAIENDEITVFSSYPIEQGTFISPSKMEAESYSENGKVYEKKVKIEDVAWIDPTQGQYAQVKNKNQKVIDNQGRQLSKEQQEYFKNSKVRDEQGNLLEVYHGSYTDKITIFDIEKTSEDNVFGRGFYFTDNKMYAESYAEESDTPYVYSNYVNIENPFVVKGERTEDLANAVLAKDKNANIIDKDYGVADTGLIKEWLIDNGYDGIKVELNSKEDGNFYLAFESNQIKNVDNTTPTDSPDIRYSKNDNGKWQEFLDKNSMNDGTKTALGDLKMSKEQDTNITSNAQDTQTNYTAPVKARQYEHRQRNTFKKNMSNMLGISQFNQNNKALFDTALDQLRAEYNQRGSISKEVRNDIFNNLYNNLLIEDKAFYETNKELKDNIRTTKLYIDNKTKVSIVDYDDFRKSAIGSAVLTNEKGNVPIDSYYQELNELNPDLFPIDITNTADQLKRIVEVSKSIRKAERNVTEYNDIYMAKEYRQYAQQEFNSYVDKLANEYKTVDRYTQDRIKQSQKEEYVKPELQEIRNYYENRNLLQKEIEKQEKNLLLTQREKAVVDRLLKDEMDVSEILPGLNKEAIIKSYRARQQLDYLKQSIKEYKAQVKQDLKDVADSLTVDAETWKDKSWGLWYARETATRNMQDIMSKESAERVNKELFEPIIHNTAEQTRFLNEYSDTIEKLDLDKKEKYDWKDSAGNDIKIDEATVAQLLIEKEIDDTYLRNNGLDANRIKTIANTFEKLLKDTVSQMDDVYIQFGYAPVEKRKNYFPHFMENQPDTFMSKFANAFGFKVCQEDLPTDIAGRTETFKPGRAFDRNILRRTTNKTDYNALKALDMYMQGASDIIYHTEDIQKLRAFNESIRDRFRTSEIQKKLDAINENPEYTAEERVAERQKIIDAQKTPLNNLVTWVDEYTNVLANKKSSADRQLEKDTSRQAYTTMKDIEGKIASNLIGGNFSVALTNFAPLSQAMGTTKTGNILIGMLQTTQNNISETLKGEGDSFVNESDFLTSRRGNDLTQKETFAQKFSNTVSTPMELIDNFTSESIVRAKYRENIKNGMDHSEALKNADTYARNLMADRSKGAMPTVFSRTNPVTKLITAFQVEPNNIISNYFKDMPRDAKVNRQNLASQITKLSVASYAFNTILKSIRGGGDVIPNPIGIVSQLVALAIHNLDDDDENDEKISEVLGSIANDILGCIPAGSAIATGGVAVGIDELQDNGKLMTSSAMPDFTKVAKLFNGNVSNDYKKQVVANELTKPLLYLGLPTGGAQLSKTAKGLYSYAKGGSYSYDKEGNKSLQFPVKHTSTNAIKSAVFGKYSLPQAQSYLENNFDGMNAKETSLYEKTGIDFYELKDYFSKTKKASQQEKMEYVNSMNVSTDNYWELYKYNIFGNKERDDGTSQVTDAEYAIKNKLATKEEYMKLYKEAEKNKIVFPNGEKLEELKNSNLNLSTYMKYQTEVKKATNEKKKSMLPVSDDSKVLSNKEKINIIQSNDYTEHERRTIYANYIGKDDDTYNTLSKLKDGETNIDAYLDYKLQKFTADEDTSSNIIGKKVSKGTGSSKSKTLEYINNSSLSDIEKMYIIEIKYPDELNDSQKNYILDLTKRKITNEKQLEEELKKFKDIEQHKDGKWYWK